MKMRMQTYRLNYDKEAHSKSFRRTCERELKKAVGAFVEAVLIHVPSYAGTARGTLLKAAKFAGVNVLITREEGAEFTWRFSSKTKKPFILRRRPDPRKGEDVGDSKSGLTFINTSTQIGLELTNRLLSYRINEFLNMRTRDPEHFYMLTSDLPWQSYHAGRTAWNRYVRTIRTESVKKFLTATPIKIL